MCRIRALLGTFSWSGAYSSTYKVDPKERLVICLMVQVVPSPAGGIKEAFDTAVYQALVDASGSREP